jgi:cell division septation protein DedD
MRDESDQKELVLGNKQLLSIFFIVIAMLGVAFTLGYMIGRNTANVSAASMSGAPPQAMPTQSPNQSPTQAPRMADPQTAPVVQQDPTPAPVPEKVTSTSAAKPYESDGAPTPAPVAAPAPATAGNPPSYLQVAAMKRADADHMVSVLRDRGFPALIGESPKEGLFRVLVGPYKDIPSLVDAKAKLKAAGFDNPLIAR